MKVTRKDFFRITSITAAVVFMMSFASLSSTWDRNDGMQQIVMARDTLCFVGGVVDSVRVANMVDASIIEMTGIVGDMPLAYQCIFPLVTADTKIVIKYNPYAPTTTIMPMINALKKGFCSMLEGNFPPANVTLVGAHHGARATDTIVVDSAGLNLKYTVKDVYSNADYIIKCPSAMVDTVVGCGMDMCFSLMLTSIDGIDGATIEDLYPLVLDTGLHSLSILNYFRTFNADSDKVCLHMLDLLSYVDATGDVKVGSRIYTAQNITVVEWKAMRFLSDSVGVLDSAHTHQSQLVCTLSTYPWCDLGLVDEGLMYEIHVECPTGVISQGNVSAKNIQVKTNPAHTVFIYPREAASQAILSIYDIHGREIWSRKSSEQAIMWSNNDQNGRKVSSGVYLYQLKVGKDNIRGKTTIKR